MSERTFVKRDHALVDLLRVNGLDVYNSDILDESYFPRPQGGEGYVDPSLLPILAGMSVVEALAYAQRSAAGRLPDLWELVACSQGFVSDELKIIAFGACAEIKGVMSYPYIGINGKVRYIALKRNDFAIDPNTSALVVKKVSVRG